MTGDTRERIDLAEWQRRINALRPTVGKIENVAFKCPLCGTVQSMASLIAAGVPPADAERYIGFSCEGRFTDAGPFKKNRKLPVRGCDWTLGGLFQLHKIEVLMADGTARPTFELATPDEAVALMRTLAGRAEAVADG